MLSPFNSRDPAANAAIAVFLAMVAMILVVVGGMVLLPIVAIAGIAKAVHWYANRPTPTDQLYAQAQQRGIAANFPTADAYVDAYVDRFIDMVGDRLPAYHVCRRMAEIAETLYVAENLNNPLPPIAAANTIEEGRYRDRLIAYQRKTQDAPRTLDVFNATLGKCFGDFIGQLPAMAIASGDEVSKDDLDTAFATFPLIDLLPEPGLAVGSLIYPFFREDVGELDLFQSIRKQLDRNFTEASGLTGRASGGQFIPPDKYRGTPDDIVAAYLHDTPLHELFYAPIPFSFSDAQRYEHMHVVGGSGHGKTQLLQRLILEDLQRDQPPALVIIDSQGEMLRKIQQLQVFAPGWRLFERLIVVDPEDVEYPPALNMFDLKAARLGGYTQTIKEQIEASTIENFNYVFGSLAAELTSRQNTTFAFVTRLMLSIPGATMHTLRELFEDGAASIDASPFAERIRKLDATSQAYFENQFFTKTYSQTKQQIARRLYSVLQVPAFDRMLAAKTNRLDMFQALQDGTIVLINTSKALLKTEASALFGRYMIACVIAAAFERIAVPADQRHPAFLIVDEAAEYFDGNLETLLSQARKFNLGVLFAHQHLDQLTSDLRAGVAANTSIKLAGGISDKDARVLAADMRTDADFLTGMSKGPHATEFACYVRNFTSNAVRLTIPFGTLEAAPTMSAKDRALVIARNRERIAAGPDLSRTAAAGPEPTPPNAGDGAAAERQPADAEADWRS